MIESGIYKTDAGSVVEVTNKGHRIWFDWFEENACSECFPYISDSENLYWHCDYCEGGFAELKRVEQEQTHG